MSLSTMILSELETLENGVAHHTIPSQGRGLDRHSDQRHAKERMVSYNDG
jgi:hypothetical protein